MMGSTNNDAHLNPTQLQQTYYAAPLPVPQAISEWSDSSSSQSSVNSVASSLSLRSTSSIDSICSSNSSESSGSYRKQPQRSHTDVVAPELRQNPRRTSTGPITRSGCPPRLLHQQDRKVNFVDSLVDSAALLVEAIWPLSSVVCRNEMSQKAVLPLRTFIQETLKRSRTSYSTLQVTMYYLVLIKSHVPRHDFTMEQPDEQPAGRALQCGRRVFLAALILASKYLQDRNYSARAWSKISGLHTQEINQNETAFLHAVNWNLHITGAVWKRWTRILLDYRPPTTPPSPGGSVWPMAFSQQLMEWKRAMLQLDPDLLNQAHLANLAKISPFARSTSPVFAFEAQESAPSTPTVMEPSPISAYTPNRRVPALGLLPTPRLTPQLSGFSTPAANTVPQLPARGSSMTLAMSQASNANAAQAQDCWPVMVTPSPGAMPTRRPSMTAYSTTSSPESMISDVSHLSRSSSISSTASLANATTTGGRLAVPSSRIRIAKYSGERFGLKPLVIPSVPEDYERRFTSSPEPYAAAGVVKTGGATPYAETLLGRRESALEAMVGSSADDAARTLHNLGQWCGSSPLRGPGPLARAGSKRGRSDSVENPLQENVREMLSSGVDGDNVGLWPEALVRPKTGAAPDVMQVPAPRLVRRGSKRLCCSAEVSQELRVGYMDGLGRTGIWTGIP